MIRFEWDDGNIAHLAKHDVTPSEAEEVIHNEPFDIELQNEKDEERTLQVGETNTGRILMVVSTLRKRKIRVVTAFDAPKAMKAIYLKEKAKTYGTGS